jgi:putative copper resistance protein D
MEAKAQEPVRRAKIGLILLISLALPGFFPGTLLHAQEPQPMHHEHAGHEGMDMQMNSPMDSAARAKLEAKILADKKESEFNHHLAGFLVALAGAFVLFQAELTKRHPWAKYVWPACFLLAGLFVLAWSDTELWPFGHKAWLLALRTDREVLQHKSFAVLLLALGTIEWQRARGVLKAAWSGWVFPVVALLGSIILIFHHHEGGMVGEHHMETMARIQSQHLSYTACGLGIGLTKGLSELTVPGAKLFARVWPLLLIALGVLLMFYKE